MLRYAAILRIWGLASLALVALGAFPSSAQSSERTLAIRLIDEPETLDWTRAHTDVETFLLMNLMEGLVYFDSSMKLTPVLARDWSISSDGKIYTFHLKPEVKWSDGVPLRAQDFVYSWRRLLSPITAASYAYLLFDVVGAEDFNKKKITDPAAIGIKALDDHTLQIKLKQRAPMFLFNLTFWSTFPLRQDVVEKYGEAWSTPGRMVTLGPYRLTSHDVDQQYVLHSNANYYGRRGNVDKLVALIVKDDSTAIDLYEKGKIDLLVDLSVSQTNLARHPDLRSFVYLRTNYMGFAINNYPVDIPSVRRAIAMSIDHAAIAKLMLKAQPATTFVPPGLIGYSPKVGLPFDPAKAKADFRKSGIDPYRKLELTLIFQDRATESAIADAIKEQLSRSLGIQVKLLPMENRPFRVQLDLHSSPLALGHWSLDFPDPDNFMSIFLTESGNNRFSWHNEMLDKLVLAAREETSPPKREKLYLAAQKILLEDDAILVPLYYESKVFLIRPRVHGVHLNTVDFMLLGQIDLTN